MSTSLPDEIYYMALFFRDDTLSMFSTVNRSTLHISLNRLKQYFPDLGIVAAPNSL